jgi:hypothetical protein
MDQKVFDTLMDEKVITHVGLNAADYNDLADLQEHDIATSLSADEEYAKATEEDTPVEDTPVEDTPVIETPEEVEGEF